MDSASQEYESVVCSALNTFGLLFSASWQRRIALLESQLAFVSKKTSPTSRSARHDSRTSQRDNYFLPRSAFHWSLMAAHLSMMFAFQKAAINNSVKPTYVITTVIHQPRGDKQRYFSMWHF